MLSTTDRSSERGQVLVLFAGGLVALFLIAALAFDVGVMYLERRDQQNAADAAALAGARYVLGAGSFVGTCAAGSTNPAVVAACDIAVANDDQRADVTVKIPPQDGQFRRLPGHVEVQINTTKGSVFGGVIGKAVWPVGVMAVAANQPGVTYPFGMLALNPTKCKAILISGTGTVNSESNVQSNSTGEGCGDGSNIGFSRTGSGTLNVEGPDATCRSGGELQDQGSGDLNCTPDEYGFAIPDPLAGLPAPVKPPLAPALKTVVAGVVNATPPGVPDYCPGASNVSRQPDELAPRTCVLGQGTVAGVAQAGRTWILSPGLYPGGLNLKGGVTALLLPGIYWIGGGGFSAENNVSVISIESETNRAAAVCTPYVFGTPPTPCTGGGGILIYNSTLPATGGAAGPITLGGGGATLNLQPYAYPFASSTIDLVIFQDRTVSLTVTLNGSDSQAANVRGIIYVPLGAGQGERREQRVHARPDHCRLVRDQRLRRNGERPPRDRHRRDDLGRRARRVAFVRVSGIRIRAA